MRITRTQAPATALLSVSDVKQYMGVVDDADDGLIQSMIAAVTARLDGYYGSINRSLHTQEWLMELENFPVNDWIRLHASPIQSVLSVEYDASDGTVQQWTAYTTLYEYGLEYLVPSVKGASYPTNVRTDTAGNHVRIRYTAGSDTVPEPILIAARAMVQHLYDHRSQYLTNGAANIRMNPSIMNMLAPYDLNIG